GLAAEGIALAGSPDRHRIEDGRLDDDVGRAVLDLGRRGAHDAGDADRAAGVRDEERVRVERSLNVVERLDLLARLRAPDDQTVAAVGPRRDPRCVVRVDRLAELEHHVVARVDDVADRADAGGAEAHLDAIRRRPDRDAAAPAADASRAQARIAHSDPHTPPPPLARLPHVAAGA